jgi:hypothetical protein
MLPASATPTVSNHANILDKYKTQQIANALAQGPNQHMDKIQRHKKREGGDQHGTRRDWEETTRDSPELRRRRPPPRLQPKCCHRAAGEAEVHACNVCITMDTPLWSNSPRRTKATKIPGGIGLQSRGATDQI